MNDHPTRILLVKDDQGDARLLRETPAEARIMRSELVRSRQHGEILQYFRAKSFDVILMDPSLRDGPGWETCGKLCGYTTHVSIGTQQQVAYPRPLG
jgi:DNA-binding response OmpR family regulator